MKCKPITEQGYRLLHDGALALSEVERNGVRVDVKYIKKTYKRLEEMRVEYERQMAETKVWRHWAKMFGHAAELGKDAQLREVLFSEHKHSMGYKSHVYTRTGLAGVDQYNLKTTRDPFVDIYIKWKQCDKVGGTFLKNILRETTSDGMVRPFFNLNTAKSYRSSCDSPNFQFNPTRDIIQAELVRKSIIPLTKDHSIVENDFKGLEVAGAACQTMDPKLIKYVKNPKLDMHRDRAMGMFFLDLEFFANKGKGSKEIRHLAKNGFVFPEFYGDFYKQITPLVWEAIGQRDLLGPDGKSLYKWLKRHGIKECGACDFDGEAVPGTLEYHIMKMERELWSEFKVYKKWKKDFWEAYLRNGYFDSMTGFRYSGVPFKKNQVTNIPIQGSSFHCLLQVLIWYLKKIKKIKLKTKVGAQIHDSVFSYVRNDQLDDHSALITDLVSRKLREHWDWIVVPMEIETEIAPSETTWFDKKTVVFNRDMTTYNYSGKDYLSSVELLNAIREDILTK